MYGFDLTHGQLSGPRLTDGRLSDHRSPFRKMRLLARSLYIADLGYFDLAAAMERRAAGSYTLTRARTNTVFFTEEGHRLSTQAILPPRVGQAKQMHVLVGEKQRYRMRLLMIRVPGEVASGDVRTCTRTLHVVGGQFRSVRWHWRIGRSC